MLGWLDSGICPIGIDVGTHAIRMVQLRRKSEGLALQAACRIELASLDAASSPAEKLVAAARHGLSSHPFVGRKVALALPASRIHAKSVRLPQMPDSDLTQALQWEAKDRFGFEIGQGRMVWFRAGEVRRGTEVKDELLLFAVEGDILTEYLDALSGAGLHVGAIDLPACAAWRSLRRAAPGSATGTGALLDFGHAGAQFTITRDDELVFYKYIDIGGAVISEAIASKLGISPAEAAQMRTRLAAPSESQEAPPLDQALHDAMRAPLEELAREIDMCMRYYVVTFRGARPDTIALAGGQAGSAQVSQSLAAALGLNVEEAQAFRGVLELGDAARPDRSGEWAVAAGLSLFPLQQAAAPVEAAA